MSLTSRVRTAVPPSRQQVNRRLRLALIPIGRLKGNRGNQQYDLPDGVRAGSVVIWCRAFSVAFGVAELT
jgi:Electron transfer DM13